jgi:hypothetical protein
MDDPSLRDNMEEVGQGPSQHEESDEEGNKAADYNEAT